MKLRLKPSLLSLVAFTAAPVLSGQVTISVTNYTPNGSAAAIGGSGTGVGAMTVSSGTITTNRGMPVTTYTVSNVNLTSLGGTASESFQFTVSYTATSDGTNPAVVQFNTFGNVSVTGGTSSIMVDGAETLTATIALSSSTFPGLSLSGLTAARAAGFNTSSPLEYGTMTWSGGSQTVSDAIKQVSWTAPSGVTWVTLSTLPRSDSGVSTINFEGFAAQFVAVPEPGAFTAVAGLAGLALVVARRRGKARG